jgi:hypothetical protein
VAAVQCAIVQNIKDAYYLFGGCNIAGRIILGANDRFPHLVDLDYARREHMLPGLVAAFMLLVRPSATKKELCKMKKLLLITTALVASLATAQADSITVTVTGTVSSNGFDNANLFGGSVAGDPFTASFVFDTSRGTAGTQQGGVYVYGGTQYVNIPSPALSADLNINGYDVAFPSTFRFSALYALPSQFQAVVTADNNTSNQISIDLFNLGDQHFPNVFSPFAFNSCCGDSQNSIFNFMENGLQSHGSLNTNEASPQTDESCIVPFT